MRGPPSSRTSIDLISSALFARLWTWEPDPASTPAEPGRWGWIDHGRWLVADASWESPI